MAGNKKPMTNQTKSISGSNKLLPARTQTLSSAQTVNAQTGTTYTFVLADTNALVTSGSGSATTFTVPLNVFPVGTKIDVLQIGAGQLTISPASSVTLNGTPGLKISARYAGGSLVQVSTNVWNLTGSLSA